MKLASIKTACGERAAILHANRYFLVVQINAQLGQQWPDSVFEILCSGRLSDMTAWFNENSSKLETVSFVEESDLAFAPLYRHPNKIWGIGLNYREHAGDLDESAPTGEPASFMKPTTALIGHGDTIELPRISEKTTGEAELGLIIGKTCRFIDESQWQDYVAGYTMIVDMTAEDILRRNPRNLTQSKSFDTFFSLGYLLVTPDEIDDLPGTQVKTVINGRVHAENTVSNMTFPPPYLVAYHSQIMTLLPGDIISSGTPGAVPLSDGDIVECCVDGLPVLSNPVKDLKVDSVRKAG